MFSWKNVKTILFILIGNVILAFALSAFILPHGMIVGGTTGLSIIINHYFHVELSIVVAVLNVILFFCGLFFLYLALTKRWAFLQTGVKNLCGTTKHKHSKVFFLQVCEYLMSLIFGECQPSDNISTIYPQIFMGQ